MASSGLSRTNSNLAHQYSIGSSQLDASTVVNRMSEDPSFRGGTIATTRAQPSPSTALAASGTLHDHWGVLKDDIHRLLEGRSPRTRARVLQSVSAVERDLQGSDSLKRPMLTSVRNALSKHVAQLVSGGVLGYVGDSVTKVQWCPWDTASLGLTGAFDATDLYFCSDVAGRVHLRCAAQYDNGLPTASELAVFSLGAAAGSFLDVSCAPGFPGMFATAGGDGAVNIWCLDLPSSAHNSPRLTDGEISEDASAGGNPDGQILRWVKSGDGLSPKDFDDSSTVDGYNVKRSGHLESMILDESDSPRSSLLEESLVSDGLRSSVSDLSSHHSLSPTDDPTEVAPVSTPKQMSPTGQSRPTPGLGLAGSLFPKQEAVPARGGQQKLSTPPAQAPLSRSRSDGFNAATSLSQHTRVPAFKVPNDSVAALTWGNGAFAGHLVSGTRGGLLLTYDVNGGSMAADLRLVHANKAVEISSVATASQEVASIHAAVGTVQGQLQFVDFRVRDGSAGQSVMTPSAVTSRAVNSKGKKVTSCALLELGGQPFAVAADECHKLRLFDLRRMDTPAAYLEFPTSIGRIGVSAVSGTSPVVAVPQHGDCVSLVDLRTLTVCSDVRRLHGGKMVTSCDVRLAGSTGGMEIFSVVSGSIVGGLAESSFIVPSEGVPMPS